MTGLAWLLVVDGAAFVSIGSVVLAFPSARPALTRPADERTMVPLTDTRRLLASQFVGTGLLALLVGVRVPDAGTLRLAAWVRVATLLVVLAVNVSQLRDGAWKPAPLYGLIGVLGLLSLGYVALALTA